LDPTTTMASPSMAFASTNRPAEEGFSSLIADKLMASA
jgi:hypothetical protein